MENLIGKKISDFEFEMEAYHNDEIKKIKFSDYKGKWIVIVFYPADFTFVCPTELEELAEYYVKFTELGAEILSVSTDTVFVHKAWHDASPAIKKIKYPMLADPTARLCCEMGTYIENEGVSLRATFIISPDGVIKVCEMQDNSIGRSAAELLRKLQAAKFVSEHEGKVCPASWSPGSETITPELNLVGKI